MSKIKQSVKHTGRARKELIVAELVEKIDKSNGLVFTDYKGITHKQLEDLKRELKTMDATIIIAKNSLLKISLGKSAKYAEFKDNEGLNLPTATLFIGGDMVEPLKRLQKIIKEINLPKIKFGVLEGQLVDESGVLKIAALPNRETLLAQFVGTLNSPIQGLVVTLNGTIQKFVMTLDAVAKAKPAKPAGAVVEPSVPAVTAPATTTNQASTETSTVEPADTANDAVVEPSVSANEPATQPDAPVVTDESDPTEATSDAEVAAEAKETETTETAEETTDETKTEDEKSEGGEN